MDLLYWILGSFLSGDVTIGCGHKPALLTPSVGCCQGLNFGGDSNPKWPRVSLFFVVILVGCDGESVKVKSLIDCWYILQCATLTLFLGNTLPWLPIHACFLGK